MRMIIVEDIRIDIITLSDKPVEIISVAGMVASGKDKGKLKMLIPAGQWNTEKRDVYSIDDDGRILIGWADSNGAPPLDEEAGRVEAGRQRFKRLASEYRLLKMVFGCRFICTGQKETKRRNEKYTYKVGHTIYNDNYDPTFDGNEEAVKEKGNPKPTIKYGESDF